MSATAVNIYDALPYRGQAHFHTKPELLAAKARLFGLQSPAPATASFLDLGCACGDNLLPLAHQYPQARFVGIDYSVRQIEKARNSAKELNLTNLEFQAMSLADVVERLGTFDYIVCHGVYSWVSPENQNHIFRILQNNLGPQGVAYVSYNTFPGWHFLSAIRSLLLRQVREIHDPLQKVAKARAYLNFLAKTLGKEDSVYAKLLNLQAENFKKFHDSYIFHEYLEEDNAPCYFGEFMERAAKFGLQYLSEAKVNAGLANLPPEVKMQLQDLASTRVEYEQQFDNIHNTTFRRTLLCHASVKLSPQPLAESLRHMSFSTISVPEGGAVDLDPESMAKFTAKEEISFQTNKPLFKAAMVCLSEARPRSLSFDTLFAQVCERLTLPSDPAAFEKEQKMLLAFLLQCHLSEMLEIHSCDATFSITLGARPVVSRVARWQTQRGERVNNLRHHLVDLNECDKIILQLLDGTRTLDDVQQELITKVRQGVLNLAKDGKPLQSSQEIETAVHALLVQSVQKMVRNELFES